MTNKVKYGIMNTETRGWGRSEKRRGRGVSHTVVEETKWVRLPPSPPKKVKKPLDKQSQVWYNVSVKQRSPKQDRPIERRKKFFGKAEKGLDKRLKL